MRDGIIFIFSFLLGIGGGTLGTAIYFFSNINKIKILPSLFKKVHPLMFFFLLSFLLSSIFSPFRAFSLINFLVLFFMFTIYMFFIGEEFDGNKMEKFWDYFIFGTSLMAFAGITVFFYKGVYAETPFIGKNGLGTLLATVVPIIQWKIIKNSENKLWYYLCLIITLIGLILTMSQGAILGLITGETLFFICGDKKAKKNILILTLLGLFILSIFLVRSLVVKDSLFSLFKTRIDPFSTSKTARIFIWKSAWNIFLDYPITGVGFGSFSKIYPMYKIPEAIEENFSFAHNLPLNLLAETGILGFLGFSSMVIRFILLGFKRYFRRRDTFILSLLSSFSAYMTHQLFDGTMWSLHLGMIFFVFIFFLDYEKQNSFSSSLF